MRSALTGHVHSENHRAAHGANGHFCLVLILIKQLLDKGSHAVVVASAQGEEVQVVVIAKLQVGDVKTGQQGNNR